MKVLVASTIAVLVALVSAGGAWAYIKDAEARELRAKVHELNQIMDAGSYCDNLENTGKGACQSYETLSQECLSVRLRAGSPPSPVGGVVIAGFDRGTGADGIEELRRSVNHLEMMLEKEKDHLPYMP